MKFYSQHGEDFLLWRFFDFKTKGVFIEVGAFDGKYISNTLSFEENGWSGVLVEPIYEYYKLCKKNRINSKTIHGACNSYNAEEVAFNVDSTGLLSSLKDNEEYKNDQIERRGKSGFVYKGTETRKVPSFTLDSLIKEHISEPIDFISIDVEGFELEVLKGIDFTNLNCKVLVIEANSEDGSNLITDYLESKSDFRFVKRLVINNFYLKNQHDSKKLEKIIIQCKIEPQIHPKGLYYSIPKFISGCYIDDIIQNQLNNILLREKHFRKEIIDIRNSYSYRVGYSFLFPLKFLYRITVNGLKKLNII